MRRTGILLWLLFLLSFILTESLSRDWCQRAGVSKESVHCDAKISLEGLSRSVFGKSMAAVNIGARDGIDHDPLYSVYHNLSFSGIVFEGNPAMQPILAANMAQANRSRNVHVINEFASSKTIGDKFAQYKIPQDLDVLKIDIDSQDFAILAAILALNVNYKPRIVIVEFNPDLPPPLSWYLDESENFKYQNKYGWFGSYGASIDALFTLMVRDYDYALVDIELYDPGLLDDERSEHNLWFVRRTLIPLPGAGITKWTDMVRLFWDKHNDIPKSKLPCLHIHKRNCPLEMIRHLHLTNTQVDGFTASLLLTKPEHNATAISFGEQVKKIMRRICGPNCIMPLTITKPF